MRGVAKCNPHDSFRQLWSLAIVLLFLLTVNFAIGFQGQRIHRVWSRFCPVSNLIVCWAQDTIYSSNQRSRSRSHLQKCCTWTQLSRCISCIHPSIVKNFSTFKNRNILQNGLLEANNETLPKAQRTRGLSSAYQSNLFRSYHKFKHKSWSNFIFRISSKHQLQYQHLHF